MKQTNCKNCGAILTGKKCEFCGTVYDAEEKPKSMGVTISMQGMAEALKRLAEVCGESGVENNG